jgi:hypothetical protein
VSPTGTFVAVGFENSTLGLFHATRTQQPRIVQLHHHQDAVCDGCPSVDTVSFSNNGLVLVASTRYQKSGIIHTYLGRLPFTEFDELSGCRYRVPLHESEDNGVSSVTFQSGVDGEGDLICVTTWTQSGAPILIQPDGQHRIKLQTHSADRHRSQLGTRIQAAIFSGSGRELVLVNDRGNVYLTSNLNSETIDICKIATSKEFTKKSDSISVAFVTLLDEDAIAVAWADTSRLKGFVMKITITSRVSYPQHLILFVSVYFNGILR